jgi:hypothetical protein
MRKAKRSARTWAWLGLWVFLVLAGCRGGGGDLEDVTVDLALTPDPPHIGPAMVVVTLSDSEGQPIRGAEMSLEGNMNHAGMVPVLVEASEVAPGRYEAALEFTMGGDWFILVQAGLPDGRSLERQVDVPGVDVFCGTPAP